MLLVMFAIAFNANAQMPSPEEMAKKQTEAMTKDLGLNEDQAKQVHSMFLADMKAMQELMTSGSDRATVMAQMKERQTASTKKLKSILTEEQFDQYMKKMEEIAKKRRSGGGMTPPSGGGM